MFWKNCIHKYTLNEVVDIAHATYNIFPNG